MPHSTAARMARRTQPWGSPWRTRLLRLRSRPAYSSRGLCHSSATMIWWGSCRIRTGARPAANSMSQAVRLVPSSRFRTFATVWPKLCRAMASRSSKVKKGARKGRYIPPSGPRFSARARGAV